MNFTAILDVGTLKKYKRNTQQSPQFHSQVLPLKPLQLTLASLIGPLPDRLGTLAGLLLREGAELEAGHFDMDADPIEQGH